METTEYRKMSTEQLIKHLERKEKEIRHKEKEIEQFKIIIKNEKAL